MDFVEKALVRLNHWIAHNDSHQEEYEKFAAQLEEAGKDGECPADSGDGRALEEEQRMPAEGAGRPSRSDGSGEIQVPGISSLRRNRGCVTRTRIW